MLQRKPDGSKPHIRAYDYRVTVDVEESLDPSTLSMRLGDSVTFVEGVASVYVEFEGDMESDVCQCANCSKD